VRDRRDTRDKRDGRDGEASYLDPVGEFVDCGHAVKFKGNTVFYPVFKVTTCDLKAVASSTVSWNLESAGKRDAFLLTA